MKRNYDVIIVGAGYIGASAAYYLSKAGLSTLLLEQGGVAEGASRANYGNIQVQDAELEHSLPMIKMGLAYFDHLEDELGCNLHLRKIGSLLVIENDAQWQVMEKRLKTLYANGIQSELVAAAYLHELEPHLDTRILRGALYHDDEAQIYPFALITAFLRRAKEKGLTLKVNTRVIDFLKTDSRVTGVSTTEGDFWASSVVLTSGAWTKTLGESLGYDWGIHHVHGQAVVSEPLPGFLVNHLSSAAFFEEAHEAEASSPEMKEQLPFEQIPASTALALAQSFHQNLLIGEVSRPDTQYRSNVTRDAPAALAEKMIRYFPSLPHLRILRGWASAVAYTRDGMPYLGKVAGMQGLILATAFRSTVIVTPLAGEMVTQLVCNGQSELDISAFSPDR